MYKKVFVTETHEMYVNNMGLCGLTEEECLHVPADNPQVCEGAEFLMKDVLFVGYVSDEVRAFVAAQATPE